MFGDVLATILFLCVCFVHTRPVTSDRRRAAIASYPTHGPRGHGEGSGRSAATWISYLSPFSSVIIALVVGIILQHRETPAVRRDRKRGKKAEEMLKSLAKQMEPVGDQLHSLEANLELSHGSSQETLDFIKRSLERGEKNVASMDADLGTTKNTALAINGKLGSLRPILRTTKDTLRGVKGSLGSLDADLGTTRGAIKSVETTLDDLKTDVWYNQWHS
ncbi:hypothetical protein FQN49_007182 [Arthroderma sp. PD_2]|nr:hypothetical protein FQN49_007182 [Arthroderma sp. PD_2]